MKKTALLRFVRVRPHLSVGIALGAVAGTLLPSDWSNATRLLAAWDIGVWAYLASMLWMMTRADHTAVQRIAAQQDEKGPVILFVLSVAAIVSLAAIGTELAIIRTLDEAQRGWHYALAGVTLLGSWLLPAVMFTFHYAHLYYMADAQQPPLLFPDDKPQPDYWDFSYFSFTIAVAVQTSDVAVRSATLRKAVLGQSVLSFFFNLVVLGMSVNIASGVFSG